MKAVEVLIVGGGVIGMMTARELAEAGLEVGIVERGALAGEASWAGGGIVSPLYPWRYRDAITALASWSQSGYRQLCDTLAAETEIDPELRQKGLLMLDVDDEAEALAWARRCQRPMARIVGAEVGRLEPRLPPVDQALWMPEVSSVRNPRLGQALARSLALNPRVTLTSGCPISGFEVTGARVDGVRTPAGVQRAERVLIAAGAWSGELLSPLGVDLSVEPVRGQMLLFNTPGGLIDRVVLKGGRYLIPRADGRVLVGSTLEFDGFSKRTTEEAYASLHRSALEILPALADCAVEAHWCGLRPGAPGGVPYIGRVPPYDNLYVNAGQFRNGLVLAPASSRLMADLLLGREPAVDPAPYRLGAARPASLL